MLLSSTFGTEAEIMANRNDLPCNYAKSWLDLLGMYEHWNFLPHYCWFSKENKSIATLEIF